MAFTVYLTADGSIEEKYGDNDVYEVRDNGLLVVKPAYGSMRTKIYSTNGWSNLSADSDHEPGVPKGEVGPRRIY